MQGQARGSDGGQAARHPCIAVRCRVGRAPLPGTRPVGDIDVLVLGEPDRDQLYKALSTAEQHLGRPVQATVRDPGWLESGSGSFYDSVTSRPMLKLTLGS
jgi:hypothetical protein